MTSEQTTEYRRYLEELARSRSLPGAEELAQAAAIAGPGFTVRELLEDPPGRSGRAIDAATSLTDEEKSGLAEAWRSTFLAPKS
jgi:hypothetical protein